jgi:glycosyltransferase involved in cell wall biosynthesis
MTTPSPLVSVVMSVRNDVHRLAAAVESVLSQSWDVLELIVVDDGSTDGSAQLLDALAVADPRVLVVHQANAGLTRALIHGCGLARGEFIARHDSDDTSHSLRLEEQVRLLQEDPRVGFVSCPTQYHGPGGEPLMLVARPVDPVDASRGLMERNEGPPHHGSVMFRRELYQRVGGYRAQFRFAQDADLWLRMGEESMIGYLPDVRYFASRDVESTSGRFRPYQREFGQIAHLCRHARASGADETPYLDRAERLSESVAATSRGGKVGKSAAVDAAYLIGSQLVANSDARARTYLRQVIAQRPWHWRAWVRLAQAALLK